MNSTAPLSYSQQQFFIGQKLHPTSTAYNEAFTIYFGEAMDNEALEESINAVIMRHVALRTTFEDVDGIGYQHVHSSLQIKLQLLNLTASSQENEENFLAEARVFAKQQFNLAQLPLLTVLLVKMGNHDERLIVVMHHIIIDSVSIELFCTDLEQSYRALLANDKRPLPPYCGPTSVDCAIQQRSLHNKAAWLPHLAYWQEKLKNVEIGPLSIELYDYKSKDEGCAHLPLTITTITETEMQLFCRERKVSLLTFFSAAIRALFCCYASSKDMIFGSILSLRDRRELLDVFGNFMNMGVFRNPIHDMMSFDAILESERMTWLKSLKHQAPFERVIEAVNPQIRPGEIPLIQVTIIYDPRFKGANRSTWTWEFIDVVPDVAKYGILFFITPLANGSGFTGYIEYRQDRFDERVISFLNHALNRTVCSISKWSSQPLTKWWQHHFLDTELKTRNMLHQSIRNYPNQQAKLSKDANRQEVADQMITWLRDYADKKLDSRLIDECHSIPTELHFELGARGFMGMAVSRAHSGLGFQTQDILRVLEQLGAIDLTLASLISDSILHTYALENFGTKEHCEAFLPMMATGRATACWAMSEPGPGSDLSTISATATPVGKDEWFLNGIKCWIGGAASASLVIAFVKLFNDNGRPLGLTAFIFPKTTPGVEVGVRIPNMGLRGSEQSILYFKDVRVTKKNVIGSLGDGSSIAQRCLNYMRLAITGISIGGTKRALQLIQRYAGRRQISTGCLLENPLTRTILTECMVELHAVEALTKILADQYDAADSDPPDEGCLVVKVTSTELLGRVADKLLQILGARGYDETNLAAKFYRDARPFRIFEGPTETLIMYLGAGGLNKASSLFHLIAGTLGQAEFADELRVAISDLRLKHRENDMSDPDARKSAKYWIYHIIGEWLSRALLYAALKFNTEETPSQRNQKALCWMRHQIDEKIREGMRDSSLLSHMFFPDEINNTIHGYISDIGDVDPSAASGGKGVDILLRKQDERSLCESAPTMSKLSIRSTTALTLHGLFIEQARLTPDHLAVVDGTTSITYTQLDERSSKLASIIREQGGGEDVPIVVYLPRSINLIVAWLAILKSGSAFVSLDIRDPRDRVTFILEEIDPPVIVTNTELISLVSNKDNQRFAAFFYCMDNPLPASTEKVTKLSENPASLAYVMYTSGSTGTPKGVMIEHNAVTNFCLHAISEYQLIQQDRVLQFASTSFDQSIEEVFGTLCSGATLVLRNDNMLQSIPRFLDECRRLQITVASLPVSFWHQIVRSMESASRLLLPSLRLIVVGGEKVCPASVNRWLELANPIPLLNTYGPTEATVVSTSQLFQAGDIPQDVSIIGRPISNVYIHLLDEKQCKVANGSIGEIYIGGTGLARGYWKQPELTMERFVNDPFNQGGKMYKTGDLARELPDGRLEYIGRQDYQFKIRGFRIEAEEVERHILAHPAVVLTAVIAADDNYGIQKLMAYVVTVPEASSNVEASLRDFLSASIPYYMIPSTFTIVESLPIMTNGKVDRRKLADGKIISKSQKKLNVLVPMTGTEKIIVRVLEEVLGVTATLSDSFMELGGNSLLAFHIVSEFAEHFGIDYPAVNLLAEPDIHAIAVSVDALVANVA